MDIEGGPPPTPFERTRRRRTGIAAVAVVALLALGGTALAGLWGPRASSDDGAAAAPDVPVPDDRDGGAEGDVPVLDRPDLSLLVGTDLALASVLVDVDDAELAMLAYQDATLAAFEPLATTDPSGPDAAALDEALESIAEAASTAGVALDAVRERMAAPVTDATAEPVRASYLEHLDAWRDHLAAIAVSPERLIAPGAADVDTLAINISAERFREAVEGALGEELDAAVVTFAEGILERGFSGMDREPTA